MTQIAILIRDHYLRRHFNPSLIESSVARLAYRTLFQYAIDLVGAKQTFDEEQFQSYAQDLYFYAVENGELPRVVCDDLEEYLTPGETYPPSHGVMEQYVELLGVLVHYYLDELAGLLKEISETMIPYQLHTIVLSSHSIVATIEVRHLITWTPPDPSTPFDGLL